MDPVSSALLGAVFGEVFLAIHHVIRVMSKAYCNELQDKLHLLILKIDEIVLKSSSDSSDDWRHFQKKLEAGVALVKRCERIHSFDCIRKYLCGKRILKLEKHIAEFMETHLLLNIMTGVQDINMDLQDQRQLLERIQARSVEIYTQIQNHGQQFQRLGDLTIAAIGTKMTQNANENSSILQQITMRPTDLQGHVDGRASCESGHGTTMRPADQTANLSIPVPDVSNPVVGFDSYIRDLKRLVFRSDVNVIGVTGMGGIGKTTLALTICNDPQVKEFFKNNIVFLTVSPKPNVKGILETMWDKIVGKKRPEFQSVEDAHRQLQMHLRSRTPQPTLVVLDNVWSRSHLENLLFDQAERYKTLVTTRDNQTIPKPHSKHIYPLKSLNDADALSLFCNWAFGQPTIPSTEDEILVKQVQAECKGLPLALKIIGSSLYGEPSPVWESAKNKLSGAESICEHHRKGLLDCLETSIDVLDDEAKQCFLDLGAFPGGRKICVDALLNIWVYVRGMEWQDACVILFELASRNLLNLTSDPGSQAISYGCGCELFFSQHDVMRHLALHLASRDNTINSKRLFMPRKKKDGIPVKWKALKDQTCKAQIVSIHTGAMKEEQWSRIDFPETEALVLFFDATEYHLPPFLHTMPRLKVLVIYNYNPKRATLNGLDGFLLETQIKAIQLEKLIIPPLYNYQRSFQSLEKLSVTLCEGLRSMTRSDTNQLRLNFPELVEITVDHCSDLEGLPARICDLTSLQRLSVTNCHLLRKLPEELGGLNVLRVLRLSACPTLATLPPSICKLGQLQFLDISLCRGLKELPGELGQLPVLKKLDMRECSGLRKLPAEVNRLKSLSHVICDEKVGEQWRHVKASAIPKLEVEIAEERFDLDWLDD